MTGVKGNAPVDLATNTSEHRLSTIGDRVTGRVLEGEEKVSAGREGRKREREHNVQDASTVLRHTSQCRWWGLYGYGRTVEWSRQLGRKGEATRRKRTGDEDEDEDSGHKTESVEDGGDGENTKSDLTLSTRNAKKGQFGKPASVHNGEAASIPTAPRRILDGWERAHRRQRQGRW
jgi:hypothetical protein